MRNPREIYAAYTIMPSLQMHQLRVAAVGKLICEDFSSKGGSASGGKKPVNERDIILACLFHDMGNILKFDLTKFPEFTAPEGVEYWESVKAECGEKYGTNQHVATEKIAREIGLSESVIAYMKAVDFTKLDETLKEGIMETLICEYADMRVAPHGIVGMEQRLRDGRERYLVHGTAKEWMADSAERFETLVEAARGIEKIVLGDASIVPEDINDAAAAPLIEELWEYEVP
ncbi:HD domain-containing protein [Candidatus Kaiserbacteria bacterium]|nr:HD domain-containing protein [Candidatus Kaiserbacteria bacterium]